MLDASSDPFSLEAFDLPGHFYTPVVDRPAGRGVSVASPLPAGLLENKGNYSVPASTGWENRHRERIAELRRTSARVLADQAISRCGRIVADGFRVNGRRVARIYVNPRTKNTFVGNVTSCGNTWGCPYCASWDAESKRAMLRAIAKDYESKGGQVAMLTLTQGHKITDKLIDLLEKSKARLSKILSGGGKQGKKLKEQGFDGGYIAWEVTYSDTTGWHVHCHILLFFAPTFSGLPPCDFFIGRTKRQFIDSWKARTQADGYECNEGAQHFRYSDCTDSAANYLAKHGVDFEMTHAIQKRAKGQSRSPFQILEDFAKHWSGRDAELYREFFAVFKGKQKLTPFGKVRKQYAAFEPNEVQPREFDTLPGELNEVDEPKELCSIDYEVFEAVAKQGGAHDLLEAARVGGVPAVQALLKTFGFDWGVYGPNVATRNHRPKRQQKKET